MGRIFLSPPSKQDPAQGGGTGKTNMKTNDSALPWLNKNLLCLASASPRRLDLLQQVGLRPIVQPTDLDETQHPGEEVLAYVERMALEKAKAGSNLVHADLVLGADTVVVLAGQSLGKPDSPDAARHMLARLSGLQHRVLTAVAVHQPHTHRSLQRVVETRVWIKPLSPQEITAYVATGEPMDKAGAYGIQGLGAFLVARMEGSYSGVVGLPIYETLTLLREFT